MNNVVTDDLASCDAVSVDIKCFNGNVNSLDKDRLNGTPVLPKLDWKIHRLLWIAYEKNCDNEKCLIATLSKDVILFILEFFFIYKPCFITMKFDGDKTLNHVTQKYFEYLQDNENHLYDELLSLKSCENKNINDIKLGDHISLVTGATGVVKYIDTPNFVNEDEKVIGLELNGWNPNLTDGTICDKRVFEASRGRAYFVHCNSYINIVCSDLRKGFCARLQGFEKETQFNGKTVKIVSWVSKKKRWKVRLLENDGERKYLGVRSKNLVPTLDWHDDTNVYVESLESMPNVGEKQKQRPRRYYIN